MAEKFTFRKRLLLSLWLILTIGVFAPAWYYYGGLNREILADAKKDAVQQLDHILWVIDREKGLESPEQLQGLLAQLGKQLGIRITYLTLNGRTVADSEIPLARTETLENLAGRPEFMQAMNGDFGLCIRSSRVDQLEHIYVAKRTGPHGPIPAGMIRAANPFTPVKDFLEDLRRSFLLLGAIIFAATILLSWMLIRQLRLPIADVVRAVDAIGGGDFKQRVHFGPEDELYPLGKAVNEMARSIEGRILAISERGDRLEAVFDGMQEGVMVLDAKGRIRSVNRAFIELVSEMPDSVGRQPLEVLRNLEIQEACERILSSPDKAGVLPFSIEIVLANQRTFSVNIVKLDETAQEAGAIVVFHDISELKRLERVRQDFVANVSHELRTPLTSIKGYTETLLAESAGRDDTVSNFLNVILKNTNHMVSMADDLLQLARLEARHQPFRPAPVEVAEALAAALRACAPAAAEKSVEMVNELPERPIRVLSDFDQLLQIFRNLLENGIKYGPAGGKLTVGCAIEGAKATFSIRDSGPGIPKRHHQRIFERFYRVGKHRETATGSTGLGLAICKHIVQSHGGAIWVQSPNPGDTKGTTFYFSILLANGGN